MFLSVSVCLSVCLSLSLQVCQTLSLGLSLCLSLPLSLSICFSFSLFLFIVEKTSARGWRWLSVHCPEAFSSSPFMSLLKYFPLPKGFASSFPQPYFPSHLPFYTPLPLPPSYLCHDSSYPSSTLPCLPPPPPPLPLPLYHTPSAFMPSLPPLPPPPSSFSSSPAPPHCHDIFTKGN